MSTYGLMTLTVYGLKFIATKTSIMEIKFTALFEKAIASSGIEYFTDEEVRVVEGYSDGNNYITLKV